MCGQLDASEWIGYLIGTYPHCTHGGSVPLQQFPLGPYRMWMELRDVNEFATLLAPVMYQSRDQPHSTCSAARPTGVPLEFTDPAGPSNNTRIVRYSRLAMYSLGQITRGHVRAIVVVGKLNLENPDMLLNIPG